jgi:Uma2 family endonuclease
MTAMAVQKAAKTYTSAEFSDLASLPENAGRILELVEGGIIEKMPSFVPSEIALNIGSFIKQYVREHHTGYVTAADGGYIMSGSDVFVPDVGYITRERLPQKPMREAPVPPDMAVEVKSPTDRKRDMRVKAEKYLAYGTRLVWLVFPEEQAVEVYTPDEDVKTIGIGGVLDGGDILPGFTLTVRDIFA